MLLLILISSLIRFTALPDTSLTHAVLGKGTYPLCKVGPEILSAIGISPENRLSEIIPNVSPNEKKACTWGELSASAFKNYKLLNLVAASSTLLHSVMFTPAFLISLLQSDAN